VAGGVLGVTRVNSTAIPGIFCCALQASSAACNAPGTTVSLIRSAPAVVVEPYCGFGRLLASSVI
jgi:hypothetical protein